MGVDNAQKPGGNQAEAGEAAAGADQDSERWQQARDARAVQRKQAGGAPDGANPDGADAKGQPKPAARESIEHQVVQGVMAAEGVGLEVATKIKDELLVLGGETLGVSELLGLRYPVKSYEAQVSSGLYRGSRVDGKGMAALKAQGIHGIVSFCMENDDDTKPAEALGLHHLRIPILDCGVPTEGQVRQFLAFVQNAENQPVFCHCEAGKARTGTMVACYRIAVDGWTAEQAIAEGRGYGLQLINQIKFIEKFYQDHQNGSA